MSTNRGLRITILAGTLLLLIAGCEEQPTPETQQQSENTYQESQPSDISAAELQEQHANQESKREIEQIQRGERQPEESKDQEIPAEQQSQDEGIAEQSSTAGSEGMSASERMEHQQPSFSQLDTDQDGHISKEEAEVFRALALHFDYLDQSRNGKLDPDEFDAFQAMQLHGLTHGGAKGEDYGEKYEDQPTEEEKGKGPELPSKQQGQGEPSSHSKSD